jgi:hypothetical protein
MNADPKEASSGALLDSGDRVTLTFSGVTCRVERLLGTGGQGEVHEIAVVGSTDAKFYAFKIYHPRAATKEQWEALSDLVEQGSPGPRFLWPIDLAELSDRHTFGYLMALREARYHGLVDLARRRVSSTFSFLSLAGFQLADSFLALHSRGLCYRDISLGNVFFDPLSGDVLICDNDNVSVDGKGYESVLGTTGFMAPEVERLEALPSTKTDLYSLSILLFLMFINHHPLIGRRELAFPSLDQAALRSLYGTEPLFIFDPSDDSNCPVPEIHDNALVLWPLYPVFSQKLFTRAFTTGLHDPINGRVRESTWKTAMARLRDLVTTCGCGAQVFFDDDLGTTAGNPPGICWACGGRPLVQARLVFGGRSVVLNDDTHLYPHHLGGELYDYSHPWAEVSRHPLDPRVRGLKNLSDATWVAIEPDGLLHHVGYGRSVRITDRMRITFGRREATVVVDTGRTQEHNVGEERGTKW